MHAVSYTHLDVYKRQLGAWRLRTDYQYDQSFNNGKSQANTLDFPRIYLFRPIPAINAKLTIGQYDTESSIFDSFHLDVYKRQDLE